MCIVYALACESMEACRTVGCEVDKGVGVWNDIIGVSAASE